MKLRCYTSDARLKEKYNKEQNIIMSRRLKNIKSTINTKPPESFCPYKTLTQKWNSRFHRTQVNICKL